MLPHRVTVGAGREWRRVGTVLRGAAPDRSREGHLDHSPGSRDLFEMSEDHEQYIAMTYLSRRQFLKITRGTVRHCGERAACLVLLRKIGELKL